LFDQASNNSNWPNNGSWLQKYAGQNISGGNNGALGIWYTTGNKVSRSGRFTLNNNSSFIGHTGTAGTYATAPLGGAYSNMVYVEYNAGLSSLPQGYGVFYVAPGGNFKLNSNDTSYFFVRWVSA
jgi:hypothetical protein